jgi:hypothetical protein
MAYHEPGDTRATEQIIIITKLPRKRGELRITEEQDSVNA